MQLIIDFIWKLSVWIVDLLIVRDLISLETLSLDRRLVSNKRFNFLDANPLVVCLDFEFLYSFTIMFWDLFVDLVF